MNDTQLVTGDLTPIDATQNALVLWTPRLEDEHLAAHKVFCTIPTRQRQGRCPAKNTPVAAGRFEREIKNNPNMRRHAYEVGGAIEKMVHPRSGSNSIYGIDDLNAGMVRASTMNVSVGGCANSARVVVGQNDDGPNRASPCDRWFADALARADTDDIINYFAESASENLRMIAKQRKTHKRGLTLAVDTHLIPRYDRKPGPELTRSRQKSGTTRFERYMSVQCVYDGMHLVLAFVQLDGLESMYHAAERLFNILQKNKIHIRLALFDRGFFSTGMLELLNKMGIPYLMPCVNTHGVVGALNEFAEFERMGVSVNMLDGSGRRIPYILIITKRRGSKKSSGEPKEEFIGFATNVPDIDISEYDERWMIETGYSKIEAMRVTTRSKKICSRVFCFAFSMLMYNAWVMLNAMLIYNTWLATRTGITQTTFRMFLLLRALNASEKPSQSSQDLGVQVICGGACA